MWGLLSKTTISRSGRRRLAWDAALIPAASPPIITKRSFAMVYLLIADCCHGYKLTILQGKYKSADVYFMR